MREFEVAVGRAALLKNEDVTYKLGNRELTAKCPTLGQLALFLQGGNKGGMRTISSLLEFISDISSDGDWTYIEGLLRDGLDVDVLSNISSYLIGEWTGRPTLPSVVSPPSPNGTGRKSTVKRAAKELTS